MTVRVRVAPSPTGLFHVGTARIALQNWIFAKQHGGVLVLRVEDTDASRNQPEWVDAIYSAMSWLGITPDQYEGPYLQSSYAAEHHAATEKLAASGQTYFCDCTRDMVQARTGSQHQGYDGFCRQRGLTAGPGRALRFRTPDSGETRIVDLIRGEPAFDNALMEDFVIARADGSAVFLLANVVDDASMGITHVIRGEDHLSNTPKQQLLWQALGYEPPVWAHLPLIVNEQRRKLSKRRDKVALESYRDEGYLPETMRNYLMLLGWAPSGDREIVPWSVIEEEFRIEDVNPSPAFFDLQKLRAFNGEYLRALPVEQFVAACQPWLVGTETIPAPPWQPADFDPAAFAEVAPLAQSRVAVLAEIVPNVDFLFLAEPVTDEGSWSKAMKAGSAELLDDAIEAYQELSPWRAEELKATTEQVGAARGLKLGKAQAPIRVAVTGRTVGLPLFESMAVLGRERTLARLRAARSRLS
ncbi:glutamate--tRNA ligase [Natronosporangium hydrolyticum]|uniref:Glutamate--tRNA ligase n=1 Tax=Natronosporangium hydrolyticum TaxID=2811111 RepID=A0A895Y6D4_9ACTN|nr:glutamate--tRNA ligase [Natronosporangium hydrolyticum]QSB13317.1 glutamate--tRNA ligase [Natronosporangium hydrolyticum]